jgi:hypothetical protein
MTETTLAVDAWCVFELDFGVLKEVREGGGASFSNGATQISGQLFDRLRPLTLRNKVIVEDFNRYYDELRRLDGQAGFNFPDIHRHFATPALNAIDNPEQIRHYYDLARDFVREARSYKPFIQTISLFRSAA